MSSVRLEHVRKVFPASGALQHDEQSAIVAVEDVSLELNAGDRLGIIGRNGAGVSRCAQYLR